MTIMRITSVDPAHVRIHLAEGTNYFAHDVVLKPHQTYQPRPGEF